MTALTTKLSLVTSGCEVNHVSVAVRTGVVQCILCYFKLCFYGCLLSSCSCVLTVFVRSFMTLFCSWSIFLVPLPFILKVCVYCLFLICIQGLCILFLCLLYLLSIFIGFFSLFLCITFIVFNRVPLQSTFFVSFLFVFTVFDCYFFFCIYGLCLLFVSVYNNIVGSKFCPITK